ncbi:uncharacterized protein LOC117296407 [Asterias rubens]|uniref:uncharacterized protein LOC117296407 n=1 Tax=Asterias rubens TaxID=7604 RepID=UPI001455B78E|nr:uncharacterized protein LOC117296407 [Asterias rubens]
MPRRSHSNPIGSIQTALEQFFREEGIEYACGECDCKQAIVTHKFTKLPSKQPRQTILLESNTDSDDDETQKVLEMSKKESERKKREADERLRLEEEELKKV